MDMRFTCEDCRLKWFVPGSRPIEAEPTHCAACGGRLLPLVLDGEDGPPAPGALDPAS